MNNRINIVELHRLLEEGYNPAECARKLGVNRSSVTRAIAKGRIKTSRAIVLGKSGKIVDRKFNIMEQYERDTDILNELLDGVIKYIYGDKHPFKPMQRRTGSMSVGEGAEGKKDEKEEQEGAAKGNRKKTKIEEKIETFDFSVDPKLLAVNIVREIREHMYLQLDIIRLLYNAEEANIFQQEVIQILGEIDPEARQKFLSRLNERRRIRVCIKPYGIEKK